MSKRILVIDDEAHIVQVLLLKLRNAGYEVFSAGDGEEGLDQALQHAPDLIITDFQMPYMTGLELAREMLKHAELRHTPLLMLTARGYALDADDLANVNIRAVLSKPFSPRAIVEHIKCILDGASGTAVTNGDASNVTGEADPRMIHAERGKAA